MSNKIIISAFKNSSAHPAKPNPLSILGPSIDGGRDVIEAWEEWQCLSESGMARILGCSQQDYKMHKERLLKPSSMHSPLRGVHFLNFARHIKVHPFDLASDSLTPEKSYPPALYESLQMLFFKPNAHFLDRDKAGLGLMIEAKRYDKFKANEKGIAGSFEDIHLHADRLTSFNSGKTVMENLKAIADKDLRSVLLESFKAEKSARLTFQPQNHIDDYHTVKRLELEKKQKEIESRHKTDMDLTGKIRTTVAQLYGGYKADNIIRDLDDAINDSIKKDSRNILPRFKGILGARRGLLDKELPGEAMDSLCEDICKLAKHRKETRGEAALLRVDFSNVVKLDAWLIKAQQQPEFYYLHNLYCNNAMSRRVSDKEHMKFIKFKCII
jgi:hypothetical protein